MKDSYRQHFKKGQTCHNNTQKLTGCNPQPMGWIYPKIVNPITEFSFSSENENLSYQGAVVKTPHDGEQV